MVHLVNLEHPDVVYSGKIFWDMVRPGVRLAILGPQGCLTSVIKKVAARAKNEYLIQTRHSKYVLTGYPPQPLAAVASSISG